MKQFYLKPLTFRLIIVLMVMGLALIIHSCKKDNHNIQSETISDPTVMAAKQWYENSYAGAKVNKLSTQSIGHESKDWNKIFSPYWDKSVAFVSKDMTIVEAQALKKGDMAFSTLTVDSNKFDFSHSNSITSLLIIKQQNTFGIYAMTIMADPSYLKGDYGKLKNNTYRNRDKDFTGAVFYHSLDGTFINGWQYVNGKVTTPLYEGNAPDATNQLVVQSTGNQKTNTTGCTATMITTFWQNCAYYENDPNFQHPFDCYYYTTQTIYNSCGPTTPGGGGSSAPPPCTVPVGGGSTVPDNVNKVVMVVTPDPPPIDPGGGITPPAPPGTPPNPCPTKTVVDTIFIDPCAQKVSVNSKAANSTIAQQNNQIRANTGANEYGTEQNLSTFPGSTYLNTPVRTDGSPNTFNFNLTWNSTNGYTIGMAHSHPGGSAPSPADVFIMIDNLITNQQLRTSGATAINFYKKNVSLTVITSISTYIVTIKNWDAFQASYSTYSDNNAAFEANYINTAATNQSTEYALLSIFGSAINLYKASPGSTNFIPLTINNNQVIALPCP
ncbi:MAG TPA: hypothetical protein VK668_04735 [Mucilaginibacter sp.]|nr:hypothetical protein [Mucilaginibacter sp.]